MNSNASCDASVVCPVCNRTFDFNVIEVHVNKCLFLNSHNAHNSDICVSENSSPIKKLKLDSNLTYLEDSKNQIPSTKQSKYNLKINKHVPLAESMRPCDLSEIVGHQDIFGTGSLLRCMLDKKKVPNMILWGPPGCGKTSIANVIGTMCKKTNSLRFVKLSAAVAGINEVKEVIKASKNEVSFNRKTILFMDEIHRFNKLQQDTFLPHIEDGTIVLIGATTENPSFSLNNALLSRCRVIVLSKLTIEDILKVLERALNNNNTSVIEDPITNTENLKNMSTKYIIERKTLLWLAEISDGDARIALGALELALSSSEPENAFDGETIIVDLEKIKNGIKRSHMMYDRKGDEHYNTISALHKSIRAGDDNAALYWVTRALHGGEDPLYLARRLIRVACEDIGLADKNAIVQAVACFQGCQHVGMPEGDVLLAQCAVYLARAPKSRDVYDAMKRCQRMLSETKGPLPPVPLDLRNAPTKLMKELGYGRNYNLKDKQQSGLTYMPEGMEDINFFRNK